MADQKITDLSDGGAIQSTDELVIARSGQNYKIAGSQTSALLYAYTAPSNQASIDTNVDGTMAGLFSQDFHVLEIWIVARSTQAASFDNMTIVLNNDTSAHYDHERLVGTSSTVSAAASNGGTSWSVFDLIGNSEAQGYYGVYKITIPGYADTSIIKTAEASISLPFSTGSIEWWGYALGWRNTAGVSRIKAAAGSGSLKTGSKLYVFGR